MFFSQMRGAGGTRSFSTCDPRHFRDTFATPWPFSRVAATVHGRRVGATLAWRMDAHRSAVFAAANGCAAGMT